MMKLEDWLDDLCVRFIINLPKSELESVERICFQVEEAQWFYEDFIRPLDPSLPSLNLRAFSLKIFQHCSLFSQWSPEHHMSAFAEFLAYKQRVPVRGAIMLNEEMDQVVLVKGWKKGANWSFPRGKINKDENDLDCAVREVYEETGFDIREAGLVKSEKEMKYIEVTMREQHMRLYVFRGVPMNTHFEPRTRKEISKIEWYKLTDLPTLKKHKHQDSNVPLQAANAFNKFYMVAPFLNPLKKWISQQRKSETRQSLPYLVPPTFSELSQDDTEDVRPQLQHVTSHGPSNLPEVAFAGKHPHDQQQDPSADLKRMLNINTPQPIEPQAPRPVLAPRTDVAKSSALLSLLRSGTTAEMRDGPSTPKEQVSFPQHVHRPHQQANLSLTAVSDPRFQGQPETWNPAISSPSQVPVGFGPQQSMSPHTSQPAHAGQTEHPTLQPWQEVPNASFQRFAPYQNTGDPQFSRSKGESSTVSAVPPASALPKLTSHTKSLLDAFKTPTSIAMPTAPSRPLTQSQALLDIFKAKPVEASTSPDSGPILAISATTLASSSQRQNEVNVSESDRKQNLMDLFRRPSPVNPTTNQPQKSTRQGLQPAELAADAAPSDHNASKQNKTKHTAKRQDRPAAPREGETAATVNGPLNQPQFDGIVKSTRKATNGDRRSPVPAHKTLFDPRNPTPVKILARPEDARGSPARSPRLSKVNPISSSPRRNVASKESKEHLKPFQPQILRRPQTPITDSVKSKKENLSDTISTTPLVQPAVDSIKQKPLQADSHRQALLSLFNNPLQTSQTSPVIHDPVSAVSTTVPSSQPISPLTEAQLQSIGPISTRSRVGSLTSSGDTRRTGLEKRQTAAGDKAFLLGYLGRIASQEGQ